MDFSDLLIEKIDKKLSVLVNRETGEWLAGTHKDSRETLQLIITDKAEKNDDIFRLIHENRAASDSNNCTINSPGIVVIHLGHNCNLKCQYCYAVKDANELNDEQISDIVNFCSGIKNNFFVQFMGGEPLLYLDKIKRLVTGIGSGQKDSSVEFGIQTNGLLLDNTEVYNFLQDNKIEFGISYDGPDGMSIPRFHHKTGVRIEASMVNLIEKKVKICLISVVTESNWERLGEYVAWAIDKGIHAIKFNPIIDNESYDEKNLERYNSALKKLFDDYISEKLYEKIIINNFQIIEDKIVTPDQSNICRKHPCGAGIEQLAIDVNGDVYPCDYLVGNESLIMGNVKSHSLPDIKNSPLRKQICTETKVHKLERCNTCGFLPFCGNCISDSFARTKTLNSFRSTCHLEKYLISGIFHQLLNDKVYQAHILER